MVNGVKVSICIPTYNRCEVLKECVTNILKYEGNLNLEIVISDNHSTDGTAIMCNSFEKEEIRYHCNEKNIGYENIYKVLTYASGDYAVLLSDEDDLDFSVLEILIEKMEKDRNIGLALGSVKGNDVSQDVKYVDAIFHGLDTQNVYMGYAGGYMSGIIYRVDVLMDVIKTYVKRILANRYLFWDYVPHKALMVLLDGRCDFLMSSKELATVRTVEKVDASAKDRSYSNMASVESRLVYMDGNIKTFLLLERDMMQKEEAMKKLYVRTVKRIIAVIDSFKSKFKSLGNQDAFLQDVSLVTSEDFCQLVIARINKEADVSLCLSDVENEQKQLKEDIDRIREWLENLNEE